MKKFFKSFGYAFAGLNYTFKTQLNFRVHGLAAAFVIALGFYCKLSQAEWLWIAIAICLVFVVELLNTAIEVLVDLVSPNQHPKAGAVKDIAAAAVLISALLAVVIALLIFVPKFIS